MAEVAPLLNLTNSGSGSDAINKVAVTHLWFLVILLPLLCNVFIQLIETTQLLRLVLYV